LKNIRSIEEEKKNLETVNASFKGDVNETNRSLTNSLKKNQELTQKLESTQSELTTLKNSKS
jgi:peptidoglycan hydrolase CwlO-like protein